MSHHKVESAPGVKGAQNGTRAGAAEERRHKADAVNDDARVEEVHDAPIPEFFDEDDDLHDWAEGSILTMLVSEEAWARNWDTPEEDEAWADL